jgi:negative regulator of flagellin synthesis FlgM
MTEKINGQGLKAADTAGMRRSEAAKPASTRGESRAASADQKASSGDTVNITASGLLMSRLEDAVQRTPAVDSERVTAIKDAIASGTYEIDDQRVADKLLKFERDVLG